MPRLIIVANRLPFSIQEDSQGLTLNPSPGGMAAALGPVRQRLNALWVGWHGLGRPMTSAEREAITLPAFARAVDIPAGNYHKYYNRVANGTFWPLLHGLPAEQLYSAADWQANLAVNALFAAQTLAAAKKDSIIWVHDFHLFMLPALLRQQGSAHKIGFFLHVPFAAAEPLQRLPQWRDVLQSLSQVDLCGVQTTRDARNLRASFAAHGIPPPPIKAFPIGIDPELFAKSRVNPAVARESALVAQQTSDKTVVLSVSRLDYTKGLREQLTAVCDTLKAKPKAHLLYRLIVAPSREALKEYRDVKSQVEALVAQINLQFPGAVHYTYQTFGFEALAAWYQRADIMLVTPLTDGMNLVVKEYIATRQKPGVAILGKNAGAATQLKQALVVDPQDKRAMAHALQAALTMPAAERQTRHAALQKEVFSHTVYTWAEGFMTALLNHP